MAISTEVTTIFGLSAVAMVSYTLRAKSNGHRVVQAVLTSLLVITAIAYSFQMKFPPLSNKQNDTQAQTVNTQVPTQAPPSSTPVHTQQEKAKALNRQPVTQMTFGDQSPIINNASHDVQYYLRHSAAKKQQEDKK